MDTQNTLLPADVRERLATSSEIRDNFAMLSELGLKRLVAHSLGLASIGLGFCSLGLQAPKPGPGFRPTRLSFYGELPLRDEDSAFPVVSDFTFRLMRACGPENVRMERGNLGPRYLFQRLGYWHDLSLLSASPPPRIKAEQASSIGLCGMALDRRGHIFATPQCANDLRNRTITVSGADSVEHVTALRTAQAIQDLSPYRDFRIVNTKPDLKMA